MSDPNDETAKRLARAKVSQIINVGSSVGRRLIRVPFVNKPTPQLKPQPPISMPRLKDFLLSYADGRRTEPECKAAAEKHFGQRIPDKSRWRPAWSQIPDSQKRPRGKRRA